MKVKMSGSLVPKTITLADVRNLLGAEVLNGEDLSIKIVAVGAADLLSDVLATSKTGTLLLTGLSDTFHQVRGFCDRQNHDPYKIN